MRLIASRANPRQPNFYLFEVYFYFFLLRCIELLFVVFFKRPEQAKLF